MHTTDTQCAENFLLWITKYSRIVSTQNDQTFQVSKWRKHFAPVLVVYIRSFQSWRFSWVNDGDIRERHPKLGVWSLHIYIYTHIYIYIYIYSYIYICSPPPRTYQNDAKDAKSLFFKPWPVLVFNLMLYQPRYLGSPYWVYLSPYLGFITS